MMSKATSGIAGASPSTIAKVSDLVADILRKQPGGVRPVGPADALTDAGISSLDMVNLMLALEAAFDVFIPAELIKPSSFRSIASIAAMIDGLRPPVALAS